MCLSAGIADVECFLLSLYHTYTHAHALSILCVCVQCETLQSNARAERSEWRRKRLDYRIEHQRELARARERLFTEKQRCSSRGRCVVELEGKVAKVRRRGRVGNFPIFRKFLSGRQMCTISR